MVAVLALMANHLTIMASDLSRHMNQILELNVEERWVRVQAGVVKDQAQSIPQTSQLFFSPELSAK